MSDTRLPTDLPTGLLIDGAWTCAAAARPSP